MSHPNHCEICEGTFRWLSGCEHTDFEIIDDHEDIWL